jgi:hypothetical protein
MCGNTTNFHNGLLVRELRVLKVQNKIETFQIQCLEVFALFAKEHNNGTTTWRYLSSAWKSATCWRSQKAVWLFGGSTWNYSSTSLVQCYKKDNENKGQWHERSNSALQLRSRSRTINSLSWVSMVPVEIQLVLSSLLEERGQSTEVYELVGWRTWRGSARRLVQILDGWCP